MSDFIIAVRSSLLEKLTKQLTDLDFILQNQLCDFYKIIPIESNNPYKAENFADNSKVLFSCVPLSA
jgi:hypothetical protein